MDKYETIGIVGEGSYGVVMKCKHNETGQLVAIKRFLETEDDLQVRKMAYREIRMLNKLCHENLVNMIEAFRRRKRLYLVFEYMDHTLLDELERLGGGLGWEISKQHVYQVLRGLDFCHNYDIVHRDVKPENILVSSNGVIKLCDFGFARLVNGANESCTDYVATRWYRAPELLVGDPRYGKPVDVWAAGCLFAEMVNGDPLFPGESDVDQLYRITTALGGLCTKHLTLIAGGPSRMLRHTSADELVGMPRSGYASIRKLFPNWDSIAVDFLAHCLHMDPELRPSCSKLLQHPFFLRNGFANKFLAKLLNFLLQESRTSPLTAKKFENRWQNVLFLQNRTNSTRKICQESCDNRWRISIRKDKFIDEAESKSISSKQIQRPFHLSRTRIKRTQQLCHYGRVSILPNVTYIRRVNRKQHLQPALRKQKDVSSSSTLF
ncbi:cyclin-dependent kinase-like 1 isoform X1 [Osmia lignaria lignaria]|uniref:cyclin-dependent kinase-like 1 isoform X1 n=1 Tax=Osmia lignaria lignaria TaxID=1437193 RepID=UPI0014789BE6|nr:cyclin-dependent kinase-like 1 isoform X1 [Osmia lignaria]